MLGVDRNKEWVPIALVQLGYGCEYTSLEVSSYK